MNLNKRNRSELRKYFETGDVPTQGEFGDLIDGMLNQKEDGIAKLPGSPLAIQAEGDASSQKKVLQLYESFADANPTWVLGMRPRVDPLDAGTQKQGLTFMDNTGASRLFIDRGTGNVGVGTITPVARLHVKGDLRVDEALNVGNLLTAEKGLTVPAGQPVSGIHSIDFAEVFFTVSDTREEAVIQHSFATFTQPVVKAHVCVQSFYMDFDRKRKVYSTFRSAQIQPSCTIDVINRMKVNVTLTCGLWGAQPQRDLDVTVLVIAVLANAV
jgi:hypothetical protein